MAVARADEEAPAAPRDWRLPNLSGKWLTLYVILWAIALPLAIDRPGQRPAHLLAARFRLARLRLLAVAGPQRHPCQCGLERRGARRAASRSTTMWSASTAGPPRRDAGWEAASAASRPRKRGETFTLREPGGAAAQCPPHRRAANRDLPFAAAGVNRTVSWLSLVVCGAAVPLVLLAAAILLFIRRRREAVPALLSFGFLLMSAFNFAANWDGLGVSRSLTDRAGRCELADYHRRAFRLPFRAICAALDGRFQPR